MMKPSEDPRFAGSRWRTLTAGCAIVLGLILYAVLAVAIGEALPSFWLVELVFYVVAGLAWIWPAKWIIRWATRHEPSG